MHLLLFVKGMAYVPLPRDISFYTAYLCTHSYFRLS
ncbi:hypothetical protein A2U01_0105882, partial [Trifolium medium]|nr:hypothetical protein [Trifolium medium]